MKDISISVRQYVSLDRIADLLCGAFDPMSNAVGYWCERVKHIAPPELVYMNDKERIVTYRYMDFPLNKGGAIILEDIEDDTPEGSLIPRKQYTIDLPAIKKGLRVMSKKFPKHYADFLNENEDAVTSDVFIQCCVFGDIIYG